MNMLARRLLRTALGGMSLFFLVGSNTAFSTEQLVITHVQPDFELGRMIIRGKNFDNGGFPIVRLGRDELDVLNLEPEKIAVRLPNAVPYGDQLLTIRTGFWSTQSDSFDATLIAPPDLLPNQIEGFYSAVQDRKLVQPGDFDSVGSTCDRGDQAISGGIVIRVIGATNGTNAPDFYFRIISVGLVIAGDTGDQSWFLQGVNESPSPLVADIRVSAICADIAD